MFPVVSQTIAATPHFFFALKMAYRSLKTGLTRGASQKKLASEAYRAIGGVARNSIANRAIVGHKHYQNKIPDPPPVSKQDVIILRFDALQRLSKPDST